MFIFEIKHQDPEIRRRGRILACILIGLFASSIFLLISNIINGFTEYLITDIVFVFGMAGLYIINRYGFYVIASLILLIGSIALPFLILEHDTITKNYITLTIPVLMGSFLFISWASFIITALLVIGTIVSGISKDIDISMLMLGVISIITYLFANSLERAREQTRLQAEELERTNATLSQTTEEQQVLLDEQEHLLHDQAQLLAAVQEMTVPIIQVFEQVLLLPLVGKLVSRRMQPLITIVLNEIANSKAQVLIIDLTGQSDMPSEVIGQLAKMTQAVRLLGCQVVLTGISATLARKLIRFPEGLQDVETFGTLQQGLGFALQQTGAVTPFAAQ